MAKHVHLVKLHLASVINPVMRLNAAVQPIREWQLGNSTSLSPFCDQTLGRASWFANDNEDDGTTMATNQTKSRMYDRDKLKSRAFGCFLNLNNPEFLKHSQSR